MKRDSGTRHAKVEARGGRAARIGPQQQIGLSLDSAIDHMYPPVGSAGDRFIVRDDNNRQAVFVQSFQNIKDIFRTLGVQVAGRFVA